MKPFGNIAVGDRFGSLVTLTPERRENGRGHGRWFWHCRCDCGGTTVVVAYNLRGQHTTSCGCRRMLACVEARTTHGEAARPRSAEYKVWTDMKSRCLNPQRRAFANYGARGITVCERWSGSFEAFLSDMGRRPSGNHEIDRIDNDRGYEPGNCRWVPRAENVRNRRVSIKLSDEQVRAIRSDGRRQDLIGYEHGVDRHYVSMIKNRKVYAHVA